MIVSKAMESDQKVVGKYDHIKRKPFVIIVSLIMISLVDCSHSAAVLVMCKPADELSSLLPKAVASSGPGGSAVTRLRELLTQLDELRDQRDGMEADYEGLKVRDKA